MSLVIESVCGEISKVTRDGFVILLCASGQSLSVKIPFFDIMNLDKLVGPGKEFSDNRQLIGKNISFSDNTLNVLPPDRK